MQWYQHLYVGEKARKKRFSIIQRIRLHRPQIHAYVITPAINGNNILDIYPGSLFVMPYYRKQKLTVIGIAWGYLEALEVARQIVDDMYRVTGGFDLALFLERDEQ